PPDRVMRNPHAPCRQVCRQRPHSNIRLLIKPGQQPLPGLPSKRPARRTPPDPPRNLPEPCALSLPDPHRRGDRNLEPLRRGPDRLTVCKSLRNPRPDTHRQWQHHASLHHPVEAVNQ
ncbi:MAG: hypothetical protein ACK56I_22235, partial [bacterium]